MHGVIPQEIIIVATAYLIQGSLTIRLTRHADWISIKNIYRHTHHG